MAAPLFAHENDLDARAFAFMDLATKADDQRLDVGEDNRGRRRLGEDGPQGFALLGVHWRMLAKTACACKRFAQAPGVAV